MCWPAWAFALRSRRTCARWTRRSSPTRRSDWASAHRSRSTNASTTTRDGNLVFINFEGLTLDTLDEAEELAAFLGRRLQELGRRVNLIVNYDNFELGRAAAPRFFQMVREHERRYFLSSTRYSTDAFLRRKLGRAFAEAKLSQQIYRSFEEATHALREHATRRQPPTTSRRESD